MTDGELRLMVLQRLYDSRKDSIPSPERWRFTPHISLFEVARICEQLDEAGLVAVKLQRMVAGSVFINSCRITSKGVDLIERGPEMNSPGDAITGNTIHISGSGPVIIGSRNQQSVQHHIQELAKSINASNGSEEEKAEAKGLLRRALEHPLLASLAGGAVGLLG